MRPIWNGRARRRRKERPRLRSIRPTPKHGRFIRALPLVITACILTVVLENTEAVTWLERLALDVQASVTRGTNESSVVLVLIEQSDVQRLFQGRTPLSADALDDLVRHITAARPKAVAVDVEADRTSPAPNAIDGVPIVWGRDASFSRRLNRFVLRPEFDNRSMPAIIGVAAQPLDSDSVVRRYAHTFATNRGVLPSLAWATVCAASGRDPVRSQDRRNDFFIAWHAYGRRVNLGAGDVTDMSPDALRATLANRIVIVGGAWNVADEHRTPDGWRLGTDIVANTVETELAGRRTPVFSRPIQIVLQLLAGVVLFILFQVTRFVRALGISVAATLVLAPLLSVWLLGTLSYWAEFAVTLIAIIGQQIYEKLRAYRTQTMTDAAGIYGDQERA